MDIEKIRQNTPGIDHVIHFNSAGASLVSRQVLETQLNYLNEEARFGGYETAAKYHEQLEDFYYQAARLINASSQEIAFTESATVAWQRAFFSIPFKSGDVILTSNAEYASNFISYLYLKDEKGVKIEIIPSDSTGEIDLRKLEERITADVKLISITHLPTNGGLVNPAEEIGKIAKKHNILYLLDACQSVGQYPIDVEKIGCHFLSATGRKFLRGPRGPGFLYINKEVLSSLKPNSLDLHSAEWITPENFKVRSDARSFETWESNFAAKLGLTIALKEANELGIQNIWKRVTQLAKYLRSGLEQIETVEVRDLGKEKSGIVTFTTSMESNILKEKLSDHGFNTTVSHKSSTLLDMTERNLEEVVRASVHYYNTEEEIDKLTRYIQELSIFRK